MNVLSRQQLQDEVHVPIRYHLRKMQPLEFVESELTEVHQLR